MFRECGWNHKDAAYIPSSPCLMLYFIPGNPIPRAVAPNARGEFVELVPGLPYVEWVLQGAALPLQEYVPHGVQEEGDERPT
eukprot:gene10216-7160_t